MLAKLLICIFTIMLPVLAMAHGVKYQYRWDLTYSNMPIMNVGVGVGCRTDDRYENPGVYSYSPSPNSLRYILTGYGTGQWSYVLSPPNLTYTGEGCKGFNYYHFQTHRNLIYCVGGTAGDNVWMNMLIDNEWQAGPHLPGTIWSPSVSIHPVYGTPDIIGGYTGTLYDVSSLTTNYWRGNPFDPWILQPKGLQRARAGHAAVPYQGYIYVFGGTGGSNTVERFDNVNWSYGPPMPITTDIRDHWAVQHGDYIYILGGITNGVNNATTWRFDGTNWLTSNVKLSTDYYGGVQRNFVAAGNLTPQGVTVPKSLIYLVGGNNWIGAGTAWSGEEYPDPTMATNPSPANMTSNLLTSLSLVSWGAMDTDDTSFDVFFGTNSTLVSSDLKQQSSTSHYDFPTPLSYNKTYYWRVNTTNPVGYTTGTLWQFSTLFSPPLASNPAPANMAINQSINLAQISWAQRTTNGTTFDVYFGEAPSPGLPQYKGNQTTNVYAPGTLEYAHTYYWRIDTVNVAGTTTGTVWRFNTWSSPPGAASKIMIVASWDEGPIGPPGAPSAQWHEVAGAPYPRCAAAMSVLSNQLYVFGSGGIGSPTNMYKYNGTNWVEVIGRPVASVWNLFAFWRNKIYSVGGDATNAYTFDGSNWEAIKSPGTVEFGGMSVFRDKLYFIGMGGVPWSYDGTNWTSFSGPPGAVGVRLESGLATLNDRLYYFVGRDTGIADSTTNVYAYDGASWTEVAGFPTPMSMVSATVLGPNIYTVGASTLVYRFNGTNWTEIAPLPWAASWRGLTTYGDSIYAIQGDNNSYTTNVFKYTPPD